MISMMFVRIGLAASSGSLTELPALKPFTSFPTDAYSHASLISDDGTVGFGSRGLVTELRTGKEIFDPMWRSKGTDGRGGVAYSTYSQGKGDWIHLVGGGEAAESRNRILAVFGTAWYVPPGSYGIGIVEFHLDAKDWRENQQWSLAERPTRPLVWLSARYADRNSIEVVAADRDAVGPCICLYRCSRTDERAGLWRFSRTRVIAPDDMKGWFVAGTISRGGDVVLSNLHGQIARVRRDGHLVARASHAGTRSDEFDWLLDVADSDIERGKAAWTFISKSANGRYFLLYDNEHKSLWLWDRPEVGAIRG